MAGNGPTARLNRQRSGKPVRGDWTQLEPLDHPVLPELSELPIPPFCEEWPYTAKKYWDSWRESPVTARWTLDDIAFAVDTICQFASTSRMTKKDGGVPLAASEMRLRMESLGLTPEGRRKGRLLLPEETPEEVEDNEGRNNVRKLPEAV